jgi:hypothetical protein
VCKSFQPITFSGKLFSQRIRTWHRILRFMIPIAKNLGFLMQEERKLFVKQKRSRPLPTLLKTVNIERFKYNPKKQTEHQYFFTLSSQTRSFPPISKRNKTYEETWHISLERSGVVRKSSFLLCKNMLIEFVIIFWAPVMSSFILSSVP